MFVCRPFRALGLGRDDVRGLAPGAIGCRPSGTESHAANDGVHPVSQGRDIAATIPGCEFVLLDSANHALLPQEPAW